MGGNQSEIYLNNASVSYPKSPSALSALESSLRSPPRDVRHTPFGLADLPNARKRASRILGCEVAQLSFVADATTGINAVIRGCLSRGAKCLVDNRPHNAIIRTLHAMDGVNWTIAPLYSQTEQPDASVVQNAPIDTDLICLTHVSNVTGAIYPVADLIRCFRERCPNALILVDAAQSAGIIELSELREADFIVLSGHKYLHSVSGAAMLIARRALPPLLFGGTGRNSSSLVVEDEDSTFVEVGTPNIGAIMALVAALEEWHADRETIRSLISERRSLLVDSIGGIAALRNLDVAEQAYSGIVSLVVDHGTAELEWVPFLRHNGLIVRGGLHCAPVQHEQLGLLEKGTLRLSVSRFTREDEIRNAASLLAECGRILGSGHSSFGNSVSLDPIVARERAAINAIIQSHKPCADLADAVEVSGTFTDGDRSQILALFEADRWKLLNPEGLTHALLKQRAMLFIAAEGAFTLTRVKDLDEALNLLSDAGINVHEDGMECR